MRDNSDCIAYLPMVFMSKIHQFFMHLASFLQNLINTNKIEIGDDKFECKQVSVAVKLASKFFTKMQEHVEDNSIPKDVPAFAKSFFVETTGGGGGGCSRTTGHQYHHQSSHQPANQKQWRG
jgi:hypothetical protein